MTVLIGGITTWYCPNCKVEYRTAEILPNRFHTCPKLRGLTAPMVRQGTKAKVEARDREDYEGSDVGRTQTDENGRPVMSVVTTRDEGTDVAVFAPVASGRAG